MKVYSVTMLENLACRDRIENYQLVHSVEVFKSFEEATSVAEEWAGEEWVKRGQVYHFSASTRAAIVRGHRI